MKTTVGIFVDGVGRRQRRALPGLQHEYLFPRRRPLSVTVDEPPAFLPDDHHRFRLLWRRGRVGVYGFVFEAGAQFKVWTIEAAWSSCVEGDAVVQVLVEQDVVIERFLSKSGATGPAMTLFEFISSDILTLVSRRQIVGIARRP